jgi:predicted DNA-binding protein
MIELNYDLKEIYERINDFLSKFTANADAYYIRGIISIELAPDDACNDFAASADLGNEDAKRMYLRYCQNLGF